MIYLTVASTYLTVGILRFFQKPTAAAYEK